MSLMLKTVFIGSKNDFNKILIHWLSQRTDLVGVVWTNADAWKETWKSRFQFTRRRLQRYGLLKVIDETLFFLYYHNFLKDEDVAELERQVIKLCLVQYNVEEWKGDSFFTTNVNAPDVRAFLAERQPDVALAMCINNYFGKALRAIPRLGAFLWHEGITPEYKGLYSPFWAVHNLDFDHIGYTLLRMNEEYDAGEVFVQGPAVDINPFCHHHGYIGHKAITDSLPAVEKFLIELEAGNAKPIDRANAKPQYYTYPGISDLIRQRFRLRRVRRKQGERISTMK